MGGAIVLALLMILFRRKRGAVIQPSSAPKANDGELLVRLELMRHYRDWMLLNDVLLPSGQGTTQIDHILVSPGGVFLIETKDMNGWVFGNPGQKQWTQSFAAGRRSRKSGIGPVPRIVDPKTVRDLFRTPGKEPEEADTVWSLSDQLWADAQLMVATKRSLRVISVRVSS